MKSNETSTRALVLGGGGVAGVAWELGILLGLYDTGVDVRELTSSSELLPDQWSVLRSPAGPISRASSPLN